MRVSYDPYHPRVPGRSVAAIGVFDGVHRAHRAVIARAVLHARRIRCVSVVLTFWPHPQGQKSLYSLEHRLRLLAELGVDVCVVARFGPRFSRMEAGVFISKILVKALRVCAVYVGANFRFGRHAQGDCALLAEHAARSGYTLEAVPVLRSQRHVISSTVIRRLVTAGKLRQAASLLGRPVSILGRVVKGDNVATRLGFPTANIDPQHDIVPPSGIYAVRVLWRGRRLGGICYIGTRPTFKAPDAPRSIEVHIFDFSRTIYREQLEILFVKKLRQQRTFPTVQALVKNVKKDILTAKNILSSH